MNRAQLQKLADDLERHVGSSALKRAYSLRPERCDTYGKRRALLASMLWECLRTSIDIEDRDQLRRYFDAKFEVTQVETNKYGHIPSVWDDTLTNEYACKLHEVALVLENDGRFHSDYNAAGSQHSGNRRDLIALACRRNKIDCPHGAFYEQLKRYFDDTYDVPPSDDGSADTASYARDPTIEFWLDKVRHPELPPKKATPMAVPAYLPPPTPTTPKETTVNKAIAITTITLANGNDVSKMTDAEVFDMIAQQEAQIETLKKIKAQPKKLVAEIAAREAGIAALVAHLDSKDA